MAVFVVIRKDKYMENQESGI